MLFEKGPLQRAGDIGDGNRIVQADIAREIDLHHVVGGAETLRQVAIDVADRDRISRRAFRAIAMNENDRFHCRFPEISRDLRSKTILFSATRHWTAPHNRPKLGAL